MHTQSEIYIFSPSPLFKKYINGGPLYMLFYTLIFLTVQVVECFILVHKVRLQSFSLFFFFWQLCNTHMNGPLYLSSPLLMGI